jgi:phage tail-like protein
VIYDNAGTEVGRWNFEAGWPSKWSASDLDAGTDDVMIEELTISHEGLFKA